MFSMVVTSIITGVLTHRVGYYTPFMIIGVCVMSAGAALLTTLNIDTQSASLIGYQILYGSGLGLATQAPNLAAQAVLSKPDISIGASLMFFSQLFSGAIFVPVGQSVLQHQLLKRLLAVPGFTAEMIQNSGATVLTNVPSALKPTVLIAYNDSLRQVFRVGLILVCINIFGALAMEWKSVKKSAIKSDSIKD
jgi:MFS family permease